MYVMKHGINNLIECKWFKKISILITEVNLVI